MIDPISVFLAPLLHKELKAAEEYQQRATLLGFSMERAGKILSEEIEISQSTTRSTLQAIEIASRRLSVEDVS